MPDEEDRAANILSQYGKMVGIYSKHSIASLSDLPASREEIKSVIASSVREVLDRKQRKLIETCYAHLAKFIPDHEFGVFLEKERLEEEMKIIPGWLGANFKNQEDETKYQKLARAFIEAKDQTDLITLRIKKEEAVLYQEIRLLTGDICSEN